MIVIMIMSRRMFSAWEEKRLIHDRPTDRPRLLPSPSPYTDGEPLCDDDDPTSSSIQRAISRAHRSLGETQLGHLQHLAKPDPGSLNRVACGLSGRNPRQPLHTLRRLVSGDYRGRSDLHRTE